MSETGGSNTSVGWSLKSDAWTVKANGEEVFRIDSSGASVTGVIRATSGQIGGFNIGSSALYNGMDGLYSSSSGVYVGTDGISVGGGSFRVTSSGAVSANNMTLTGTLTIDGTNITAAALRSGAQSAYDNSAAWTSGSNWGAAFGSASDQNSGSYQSFFRATTINCEAIYLTDNIWGLSSSGISYDRYHYVPKEATVLTGAYPSGFVWVKATNGLERQVVSSIGVTTTTLYYLGR